MRIIPFRKYGENPREIYEKVRSYFNEILEQERYTGMISEIASNFDEKYRNLDEEEKGIIKYILSGKRGGYKEGKTREYDKFYKIILDKKLPKEEIYGRVVSWNARLEVLERYFEIVEKVNKKLKESLVAYSRDILRSYLEQMGKRINENTKNAIESFVNKYEEKAEGSEKRSKIAAILAGVSLMIGGVLTPVYSLNKAGSESKIHIHENKTPKVEKQYNIATPQKILDALKEYANKNDAKIFIRKNENKPVYYITWIDKTPERLELYNKKDKWFVGKRLASFGEKLQKYLKKTFQNISTKAGIKSTRKYAGYGVEVSSEKGKNHYIIWLASIKKKPLKKKTELKERREVSKKITHEKVQELPEKIKKEAKKEEQKGYNIRIWGRPLGKDIIKK